MFTTPTEIELGGVLCLLLLILILTVAERKAREAIRKREHSRVRDQLTPEELAMWRAKGQRLHSDEVAAMRKLDENHGKAERIRSGEWKRVHPVEKKPDE